MKEIIKKFKSTYKPKDCVDCNQELSLVISDETHFDPESHNGVYKDAPEKWCPHYDVEYCCYDCGYLEHYTHADD